MYYVQSKTDRLTRLNDHPAEHRPIIPIADRARIARRDRVWAAVCALEGSSEDPRQAVHVDGHGIRGHGGAADDHSAAAVLCKDTRRLGDRRAGNAFWYRDHLRIHRRGLHLRPTTERADVGPVF